MNVLILQSSNGARKGSKPRGLSLELGGFELGVDPSSASRFPTEEKGGNFRIGEFKRLLGKLVPSNLENSPDLANTLCPAPYVGIFFCYFWAEELKFLLLAGMRRVHIEARTGRIEEWVISRPHFRDPRPLIPRTVRSAAARSYSSYLNAAKALFGR